MLKRLLIAVFVLGLFLVFSGTAFSGIGKGELIPVIKVNQNAPLFNEATDARPAQPTFKKPASALRRLPAGTSMPTPPLAYFCDNVDYAGTPWYFWTIPDAYGDDLFNMRFTSESNFDCTLKVAHILMYGDAMVGTPDMRVYLWDDDGFGFPGNKLDSVDILNAALPTSGLGYVDADFSAGNWVFSDGAEYHYGWTILGGPTDVLACISDDGNGPHSGEERASESWNAVWGTMLNDWGVDVAFNITSEVCCIEIPFTDCSYQSYWANVAYYWRAPHPSYGIVDYSMRYDVAGPETLQTVDLFVYDPGDGSFGNDDVIITIYGDNAGLPDDANQLGQVIVPAGTYPAFPSWTTVPVGLVIDETFHLSFNSTGPTGVDYESCLSDDASAGTGRSSCFYGGSWWTMLDLFGIDVNFIMDPYLCIDPYNLCATQSYYDGIQWLFALPDQYGDIADGMRISSVGQDCRVGEVSWGLYDAGVPTMYTNDSKVSIYTNSGGLPGTELASITLTPADYVLYPGLTTVDFTPLNVFISGDYFVTIESFAPDPSTGIYTISDDGSTPSGERAVENWNGAWETMLAGWGAEYDFIAYSSHCCTPYGEATCTPGSDPGWATFQGNQGRTGASELAAGDAFCDLNLNWTYQDPTSSVAFTGPAIYGDKVVCSFSDHFVVFNIADGSIAYTLTSSAGDGQLIGGSVRNTPSIVNMSISGSPTDVMFISGGSSNGVGAVDFNTGAVIWQRTILSVGAGGLFGLTRFSTFTILNIAGTDVLYFSTDNGKVAAVEAETGALYAGWTINPVSLTGATYISGATDGTNLFYSTQVTGTEGDVYSIAAADGNIDWTLSANGGLQAQNIFASYNYMEGFRGGVAYAGGRLYAGSWANDGGASDHPTDGVYYTIDASNGSLPIPAVASNRVLYSTPIVDQNHVFLPTLSQWVGGTVGGGLLAFNRHTGTLDWDATTPDEASYYANGFRTCEPDGVDDQLFVFTDEGFLYCYNSVSGDRIFRRRIDHGGGSANIGFSGAIAIANSELHIVFADFYGDLYDLTKGVDRARLEVVTYHPTIPVEDAAIPDPNLPVNLGPIITNTGCIDLVFGTVFYDENPITGSIQPDFSVGFVRDEVMNRANQIANDLTRNAFLSKFQRVNDMIADDDDLFTTREMNQEKGSTRYSAGVPIWLVGVDHPIAGDAVAPGGTIDLEITVDQGEVSRGPQSVYIAFESNDPDFFLNEATDAAGFLPEIKLTIVGGCLIDYTELNFGVTQGNVQLVTNNGRLGTGDWSPHGFEIDGDNSSYYQGSYIYGNDTYRIAVNTQDWTGGGGEDDAMVSMQADPNDCDQECSPFLDTDVPAGAITTDGGLTYDPIIADVVCKVYIDSVQNFDVDPDPLSVVWDWSAFGSPFDDTLTMGLSVSTRTFGIKEFPALANLTFEIMDFSERNGNSINNWRFGHIVDYDVGSDNASMDAGISTSWSYNTPGADAAWGSIKIPFGCGDNSNGDWDFNPMINTVGLNGTIALWDHNLYYDSAYAYLSQYAGYTDLGMDNGDGEVHNTYAGHDFGPNGTYSLGVAQFGLSGLTDASDPAEYANMANFVNKWAGFGRGDVNDDGVVNLSDILLVAATVNGGPGAIPFEHLSDVDADGDTDVDDVAYLINYYFNCGPCPMGDWVITYTP